MISSNRALDAASAASRRGEIHALNSSGAHRERRRDGGKVAGRRRAGRSARPPVKGSPPPAGRRGAAAAARAPRAVDRLVAVERVAEDGAAEWLGGRGSDGCGRCRCVQRGERRPSRARRAQRRAAARLHGRHRTRPSGGGRWAPARRSSAPWAHQRRRRGRPCRRGASRTRRGAAARASSARQHARRVHIGWCTSPGASHRQQQWARPHPRLLPAAAAAAAPAAPADLDEALANVPLQWPGAGWTTIPLGLLTAIIDVVLIEDVEVDRLRRHTSSAAARSARLEVPPALTLTLFLATAARRRARLRCTVRQSTTGSTAGAAPPARRPRAVEVRAHGHRGRAVVGFVGQGLAVGPVEGAAALVAGRPAARVVASPPSAPAAPSSSSSMGPERRVAALSIFWPAAWTCRGAREERRQLCNESTHAPPALRHTRSRRYPNLELDPLDRVAGDALALASLGRRAAGLAAHPRSGSCAHNTVDVARLAVVVSAATCAAATKRGRTRARCMWVMTSFPRD